MAKVINRTSQKIVRPDTYILDPNASGAATFTIVDITGLASSGLPDLPRWVFKNGHATVNLTIAHGGSLHFWDTADATTLTLTPGQSVTIEATGRYLYVVGH